MNCGQGPIDAFWGISGFVNVVLAEQLGALVVFPEERCVPFSHLSSLYDELALHGFQILRKEHAIRCGIVHRRELGVRMCA